MLAKESENISVINVKAGFVFRLVSSESHTDGSHLNQRLIFTNDKTFVTDEGGHNLVKYKIAD